MQKALKRSYPEREKDGGTLYEIQKRETNGAGNRHSGNTV